MTPGVPSEILTKSVVNTLLYFDIFHYPLTTTEIFQYLQTNHVQESDVQTKLDSLVNDSVLFRLGNFYSPQNNPELEVRRVKGNNLADQYLSLARKRAKLISSFPFVRAVMISGSLSKGYMDEKSDFDFFIVTEKERLWIARTLLVMYKRIFLFNSHKYFCVNYFVDSSHLEIEEKNLFTATELATLIPIVDEGHYPALMTTNTWLATFFPNYSPRTLVDTLPLEQNKVKALLESLINLLFGKYWEKLFMYATLNRWKKKYKKQYDQPDFEVAFKSKEYVSKNHPNNYQRKVMELYKEKISTFSKLNTKFMDL
jgi:molybdopterin-biosynthesis enzyme MoeA-like protein